MDSSSRFFIYFNAAFSIKIDFPEEGLEEMMREQAVKIAKERLAKVSHTMKLENQELTDTNKSKALEDLVQKILIDEPKDFWDK